MEALTARELENWIPAAAVVSQIIRAGHNAESAIEMVVLRLRSGVLRSGAENYTLNARPHDPPGGAIEIEPPKWVYADVELENDGVWRTGNLTARSDVHPRGLTYYDVKLEPEGVRRLLASADVPVGSLLKDIPKPLIVSAPEVASPPRQGGRKLAWWREPVLIELAARLYEGGLHPKKLSDLEKAATDWLGEQNEYPGERTIRNVVTPLWDRIQKEGKNY
jgi:hypothetical protein